VREKQYKDRQLLIFRAISLPAEDWLNWGIEELLSDNAEHNRSEKNGG
jgi:hypothetical protein